MASKTQTQSHPATDKGLRFIESRKRLAALHIEDHEFCCGKHRDDFVSIQRAAQSPTKQLSVSQVDFARDIWKGKAWHPVDRTAEVVTVTCVHRIAKTMTDDKGVESTVQAPCGAEVIGTRKEIGSWGTKCQEHRSNNS